ncbi:MAG: DUF4437 domain-containing protein [Litoreibacter sp.]
MKLIFTVSCGLAMLIASWSSAEPIRTLEANDIEWEITPEGVSFAQLQGNRFVEAYQALVRLPAGIVSPPHVKTANMYGMMLQGEMIHYAFGQNPEDARRIGPGSFYSIESGTPHVSACVSNSECIAYLYQDGAFDFLPVQP